MEVLSDVLRSLHVSGSVYFCDGLEAPWTQRFDDAERASFHMIRRGQCWLTADEHVDRLGPGDFVFAEPGCQHVLSSESPGATGDLDSAKTLLLCGYCRFDIRLAHPVLSGLPSLTIVRAEELLAHAWLRSTLDQLSSEYMSQRPGSEVVIDKLTEVLFVELIRINFGRTEKHAFIAALNDKAVAGALELLHKNPQNPWTIDHLAKKVALSRAALAKRFKGLVGQTIFEYLTHLRMQKARELLLGSNLRLYEVANQAGYESDLAFTKAFKRIYGITPTQFRKTTLSS